MIFDILALRATFGDSFWITYGSEPELHHILIDGGTAGTRELISALINALPEHKRVIELLVVTHIDNDHIAGIYRLLDDPTLNFRVKDIWFNSFGHLTDFAGIEEFGVVQAGNLESNILAHGISWNHAFNGRAIVVPETGQLPSITTGNGLTITVLSPYRRHLLKLKNFWQTEVTRELKKIESKLEVAEPTLPAIESFGVEMDIELLAEKRFNEDDSPTNGSSIALLFEFNKKRALFCGDAFPGVLVESLNRIENLGDIDLLKLSHHGGAKNTSVALIKKVNPSKVLISTNGSSHGHPAPETMAKVIKFSKPGCELIFNYSSPFTTIWDSPALQHRYEYSCSFPRADCPIRL